MPSPDVPDAVHVKKEHDSEAEDEHAREELAPTPSPSEYSEPELQHGWRLSLFRETGKCYTAGESKVAEQRAKNKIAASGGRDTVKGDHFFQNLKKKQRKLVSAARREAQAAHISRTDMAPPPGQFGPTNVGQCWGNPVVQVPVFFGMPYANAPYNVDRR